ncbi:hypothetical protein [Achromobacter xylosoxidans]|uniref:hypothetical protein n=1 Tax=Alcaligenes xylosoxydans xylosoxydans TaxID=85698 RepID=UPI002931A6CE|nr:hypothetical protein [Achromobacter xylosoxidans]WOB75915.1 hypothetical protein PZA07_10750 [Achromobacter xylosoxidans]
MTTTHEQTARNAEIVQRRLAGEATGALALEYQVTATRIAQVVRRHREKAGEIPARPRTKAPAGREKPADRIQPRLRKVELGLWLCAGGGVERRGETPSAAYDRWLNAAITAHVAAHFAPHVRKTARPERPYTGPVTVVPGTKVAPRAFSLSPAMEMVAQRARAAQEPLHSLAGIQERAA